MKRNHQLLDNERMWHLWCTELYRG